MQKIFAGIIIIVILLLGYEGFQALNFLTSKPEDVGREVVVVVEPGPFVRIAEQLEKEKIVTDSKKFEIFARLTGQSNRVRIGEYAFKTNMTPRAVLNILTSGKSILHVVLIQEGMSAAEIRDQLAAKGLVDGNKFDRLLKDKEFIKSLGLEVDFLEGYLYPNTYSFTRFTGEKTIVRTMVEQFKHIWEQEVARAAKVQNMSQKEVVILASIIEKETGAREERPIISSVFHNRLKIKMPLQSDPTVLYGKVGDQKNITRTDLKTDHPFNTYTRRGLPAGPISNPGREALIAAVEPATTKFLYFVSKNNGTHFFSESYSDHAKAVRGFQIDPKARQGKSWRDRLKKKGN